MLALLPLENLSGAPAPIEKIGRAFSEALVARGVPLMDAEALASFMARHRMRWAGGLATDLSRAFAAETGATGVLVTSVNLYQEEDPPRMALTSRLVSTGESAEILWIDSAAVSGDDAPGLLDLGLLHEPAPVLAEAVRRIADGLAARIADSGEPEEPQAGRTTRRVEDETAGDAPATGATGDPGAGEGRASPPEDGSHLIASEPRAGQGAHGGEGARAARRGRVERRFRPRSFYKAALPEVAQDRIAVLPFENDAPRLNAGDLLVLEFVRQLVRVPGLHVLEPGVVREALLQARVIQEGGLSLSQSDVLREMLGVDLILTGIVTEYVDVPGPWGEPRVAFSVRAFDTKRRRVVWVSTSRNTGGDGVVLFDWRRVRTAHRLAEGMARAVVHRGFVSHATAQGQSARLQRIPERRGR